MTDDHFNEILSEDTSVTVGLLGGRGTNKR